MPRLALRFVALGYLLVILVGPLCHRLLATEDGVGPALEALTSRRRSTPSADAPHHRDRGAREHRVRDRLRLAIVRKRFPGKGLLNAFVDLPLAPLPVVVGPALFLLYGREGWFGVLSRSTGSTCCSRSWRW